MPLKRNVRRAKEEEPVPEPKAIVDTKKEARAAFLERKMYPRLARAHAKRLSRRRPSPELHDD